MFFVRPRVLCLMVGAALGTIASGAVHAASVPLSLEPTSKLSVSDVPSQKDSVSFVSANQIAGNPDDKLELIGDAEIRRGGAVLRGDKITYTQKTDEVEAEGNARLSMDGAVFSGPSMRFRLTEQSGSMTDAEYEFVPRHIRGCAKNIEFLAGNKTTFSDAKITTCKREDEAWFIRMDTLDVDEFEKTATGRNASLHFLGVPVFGSPWFSFPITNERRSGILTPTFGMSSSRGVDVAVPYYLNLAPNYDVTLTPRIMTKRGVLLQTDTRFLYNDFKAEVQGDFIARDRVTKTNRNGVRAQSSYDHGPFRAWVDYNHVSDDEYLNDFSSNIRETSESILPQDYGLSYTSTYWNGALTVEKNQALHVKGADYYKPYEREPHLQLNGHVGNWNGFEFRTYIDAARFKSDDRIDGDRLIVQQSASYPIIHPGWYVFPRASWLGSWYDLKHLDRNPNLDKKRPSLTYPSLSIDTGLVFDRHTSLFNHKVRQTLEPSVYYSWAPNRDQSDVPFFDSTLSDLSYAPLFMTNEFADNDPINEANQVSTILTTKFFDEDTGLELLRASVGQRYYTRRNRADGNGRSYKTGRNDLLASMTAHLPHHLSLDSTVQYAAKNKRLVKFNAGALWRPRPSSSIGLFYRYNDPGKDYHTSNSWTDEHIKQIDFSMQWPITNRLYALLRYNYSLYKHNTIEVLGGIEYVHDCWTARVVAQRYNTASDKKETSFFIQLELNGLGSLGTSPLSELKRNIAGYQSATAYPDRIGQYDYYE